MKNDLLIVAKGNKDKVIKTLDEIQIEVKAITGKDYAVKEIKAVSEGKKHLTKGENTNGTSDVRMNIQKL